MDNQKQSRLSRLALYAAPVIGAGTLALGNFAHAAADTDISTIVSTSSDALHDQFVADAPTVLVVTVGIFLVGFLIRWLFKMARRSS